ncbi:GL19489 [Drosophila persimilis]|uniref:GL19489 n=1 Tax=Drosophila persimilis TaxID=7234 RepID=B4G9I4_DROPE|nr:GL19489 [Drosophila persimilis]
MKIRLPPLSRGLATGGPANFSAVTDQQGVGFGDPPSVGVSVSQPWPILRKLLTTPVQSLPNIFQALSGTVTHIVSMSSSDMEFEVHSKHSSSKVVPSSVGVGPRMPPQQQQHPQHMAGLSSLQSEHKQQLDTVKKAPIHKRRKLVDQLLMEKDMDKVETDVQSSIYFHLEEDEQLPPLGTKIYSNHLETKWLSITRNVANLIRYASHITDFDENDVYFITRVVGVFSLLIVQLVSEASIEEADAKPGPAAGVDVDELDADVKAKNENSNFNDLSYLNMSKARKIRDLHHTTDKDKDIYNGLCKTYFTRLMQHSNLLE